MRALIVGCGYLGRRIARDWQAAGGSVFAATRSLDRAEEFRGAGWEPVVADVARPETLADLPETDVVFCSVGWDRTSGVPREAVMVDGVRHLLEAVAGRTRRFIYTSSTGVYGQEDGGWVDEDSPTDPQTDGGRCCLAAEELIARHTASPGGVPATVLRLSGLYGPGRLLARAAALQAQTPLEGAPQAWLNLIHIDDAAAAAIACARAAQPAARYLVSDDRPIERQEYYGRLAALVGAPPPTFRAPSAAGRNKRCSNARLKRDLGLTLQYPTIAEGLPHAVHSEQPEGFAVTPPRGR